MININKDELWDVGDVILSGDHVYMICCSNGYFFIDLETGYGFKPCDSLEELVDKYIQPTDIKVNLDCNLSTENFRNNKPIAANIV